MKALAIIAIWVLSAVSALSTVQLSEPLQIGFTTHRVRGEVLSPSMVEHFHAYLQKRDFRIGLIPTNNWKVYRIRLAVVNQRLLIKKIYVEELPDARSVDLIGMLIPWRGLHADWFSGQLIEDFDESSKTHFHSQRVFVFERGRLVRTFEKRGESIEAWAQRTKR